MSSNGPPPSKKFCTGYGFNKDTFSYNNKFHNGSNKSVHKTFTANHIQLNKNGNNNNNHAHNNNNINCNSKYGSNNIQRKLLQQRQALPIYHVREDLMKHLNASDTNILIGETGSGKTTQVPQFLYEDYLLKKVR